jgi:hypothetical protein
MEGAKAASSLWGLGFGSGGGGARSVVEGQRARMAEKNARLAASAMAQQQAGRAAFGAGPAVPLHERLEQQLRMDWKEPAAEDAEEKK